MTLKAAKSGSSSRRLPRSVVVLGFVSFFNDFAADIVIPIVPLLLATVLASGPAALGLIEGVADAVASLLKLWAGRRSDILRRRRKGLIVGGYTLSNVARPLLAAVTGWVGVLLLRGIDRVGKGIRSAPRDAMIVDVIAPANIGLAFGFHRALDNAGSVLGGLTAAAILTWFAGGDLRTVIWLSALPGVVGVGLLIFGIKEVEQINYAEAVAPPPLTLKVLTTETRRFLSVIGVMAFARVSETFVMMFGYELGRSAVELLILWSTFSLMRALSAFAGGIFADRYGRSRVLVTSWTGHAVVFLAFSVVADAPTFWLVTLAYGGILGFGEGAERAVIADFARPEERGTAFGWYHLVVGIFAIPAGLAFGIIWQYAGASLAYGLASAVSVVGVTLLLGWVRLRPTVFQER